MQQQRDVHVQAHTWYSACEICARAKESEEKKTGRKDASKKKNAHCRQGHHSRMDSTQQDGIKPARYRE